MRSRTATWFECRIRYEKTMEDGMQKKVTENYVVDALSFSEAEERITEEMSVYVSGEFDIVDIKIAPYAEVFFADSDAADKWYKAKLAFITLDEKTQKEKKELLEENPQIAADWDEKVGDRMVRLCIIGRNLDKKAIAAELDELLEK